MRDRRSPDIAACGIDLDPCGLGNESDPLQTPRAVLSATRKHHLWPPWFGDQL